MDNEEERDEKLVNLLDQIEYILSIEVVKNEGINVSEETVERLRDAYLGYLRAFGMDEYSIVELSHLYRREEGESN